MKSILRPLAICIPLLVFAGAHASVVISNTRIVFPSDKNEMTVKLDNTSDQPALVKMWIDTGDQNASPETIKTPFIIAPPIARIEAKHTQNIRVVYDGDPLPKDRESVFWFNMFEAPSKKVGEKDGGLRLAFDTRIKLFFRPTGLPGSLDDAMKNLRWSVVTSGQGFAIKVNNASPYYVSLGRKLELTVGGSTYEAKNPNMVAPNGTVTFELPTLKSMPTTEATVRYFGINDYGASIELHGNVIR